MRTSWRITNADGSATKLAPMPERQLARYRKQRDDRRLTEALRIHCSCGKVCAMAILHVGVLQSVELTGTSRSSLHPGEPAHGIDGARPVAVVDGFGRDRKADFQYHERARRVTCKQCRREWVLSPEELLPHVEHADAQRAKGIRMPDRSLVF